MLWLLSCVLLIIWLAMVLFGKGGFVHIILLSAVSLFVIEWVAKRRAAM
ncbi:MAG: hypothetical protein ABR577_19705 [Pyrinomonadaceae bacterium]